MLDKGYATTDIPDRIEPINESYYRWADSIIAVNPDEFFTPEHLARYDQPIRKMPFYDKITPAVHELLTGIASALGTSAAMHAAGAQGFLHAML